jgi:hypothetical protein
LLRGEVQSGCLICYTYFQYNQSHEGVTMEELRPYIPLLIPLFLIEITLLVIALVDLIRREQVRHLPKWAWALIIIVLNFIGPIAYLILGREEA